MQEVEMEYKPSQWALACNATIRACSRSSLTDCARVVLDKLLLSGAEPTIASFQPLVRCHGCSRLKSDSMFHILYTIMIRDEEK